MGPGFGAHTPQHKQVSTIFSLPCFRKERNDGFPVSVCFVHWSAIRGRFFGTRAAASGTAHPTRDRPDSRCQLGAETAAYALRPVRAGTPGEIGADAERSEGHEPAEADARFAR